MKKIVIILIIIITVCGCSSKDKLDKIISENNYIIVDVRTEEEYNISHLKDSINIPYDEIDKSIKLDKNKIILVYCKSGTRSKIAYNNLTNLGYKVYDLGSYEEINLPKE